MKYFIGTSGWQYYHWRGEFYPQRLPSKQWLEFYSQHFLTVEINTSFYHLTRPTSFQKWHKLTPKGFVFAVKLYRFITHLKRLKTDKQTRSVLKDYLINVSFLKNKLGPILIQLPPNLKKDEKLLKNFLNVLREVKSQILSKKKLLFAIEFRHFSWLESKVYEILEKFEIGFCISDSPRWQTDFLATTDWAYLRFHGKPRLFASLYSLKELQQWAQKIKKLKIKKIFIYFNNDYKGYAVKNAKEMLKLLKEK